MNVNNLLTTWLALGVHERLCPCCFLSRGLWTAVYWCFWV